MSHNPPTATVPGKEAAGIVKDATYTPEGLLAGTVMSTSDTTLNDVDKVPASVVVQGFTVVG
jgi:hypothetical protein